jgi:hypothetical protein
MTQQRFASKKGVGQPSLFQLGFGKVGEEGRVPLPDTISQQCKSPKGTLAGLDRKAVLLQLKP